MLFWLDLPLEKRLRIWIHKPYLHEAYNKEENIIILGLQIDNNDNFYGITIFNYTLSIYFKIRINEKRLIIPYAWYEKQKSKIGIIQEEE